MVVHILLVPVNFLEEFIVNRSNMCRPVDQNSCTLCTEMVWYRAGPDPIQTCSMPPYCTQYWILCGCSHAVHAIQHQDISACRSVLSYRHGLVMFYRHFGTSAQVSGHHTRQ